nr:hypothetical protein [Vicinamibacterales bacterium]
ERLLAERRKLEAQRESLLERLVEVDRQRAAARGAEVAKLAARREDLLAQLERVYGQLDRDVPAAPGPHGEPSPAPAHVAAKAQATPR